MKCAVVAFTFGSLAGRCRGSGRQRIDRATNILGLQTTPIHKLFVRPSFCYKMKAGSASSWISTEPMLSLSNNRGVE